ncbi:MAG: diphosphomevalonate decarboxylase [Anaerolineae bacterium]|nr:diphosphomevalonate decarboxylase [Anaerolineae bacterium]
MPTRKATARAHPNIALIKYWGNRDDNLRIPVNGSISINLAGLETITTVNFSKAIAEDRLMLNGEQQAGETTGRVSRHLDHIRHLAGINLPADVQSRNNFPTGTGIASSASAFAALTAAACSALDLHPAEADLSALARLGSGSACRSVPGGFTEWHVGVDHQTSHATGIAPAEHWNLVDLVTIVSREHKIIGSTEGHRLADTSPLQAARIADTPRRLDICRAAILERDFEALADIIEQDALMMHAVLLTSRPTLIYWLPATLSIIQAVQTWRSDGIPAAFTIDAGPNVHVISTTEYRNKLNTLLGEIKGVQSVLTTGIGGPAHVISEHLDN